MHHDLYNKRVAVEKRLCETLPSVMGNANYLQQVFLNLLINARDAMPEGGKVTVATETKGFKVLIHVADTGTGISKENLDKMFTPFFTTKEAGKGTGLGLSICNKIVSQHRGEIKVKTEVNVGTTFSVVLPVTRVS